MNRIRKKLSIEKIEINSDVVLMSVGRKPNTSGLNLEALGIATDSKGTVKIDKKFKFKL